MSITPAQVTAFRDEVCKLAGIAAHPASLASGARSLLSSAGQKSLPGTVSAVTQAAKTTSPAAFVPPPRISA